MIDCLVFHKKNTLILALFSFRKYNFEIISDCTTSMNVLCRLLKNKVTLHICLSFSNDNYDSLDLQRRGILVFFFPDSKCPS